MDPETDAKATGKNEDVFGFPEIENAETTTDEASIQVNVNYINETAVEKGLKAIEAQNRILKRILEDKESVKNIIINPLDISE